MRIFRNVDDGMLEMLDLKDLNPKGFDNNTNIVLSGVIMGWCDQ